MAYKVVEFERMIKRLSHGCFILALYQADNYPWLCLGQLSTPELDTWADMKTAV